VTWPTATHRCGAGWRGGLRRGRPQLPAIPTLRNSPTRREEPTSPPRTKTAFAISPRLRVAPSTLSSCPTPGIGRGSHDAPARPTRVRHVYRMGLEHVGLVVGADLDDFSRRHRAVLTGQQFRSSTVEPVYVLFDDYAHVKFQQRSLKDARGSKVAPSSAFSTSTGIPPTSSPVHAKWPDRSGGTHRPARADRLGCGWCCAC
jgi:hypothetical protein